MIRGPTRLTPIAILQLGNTIKLGIAHWPWEGSLDHMTFPDWLVVQSITNYISPPQAAARGLVIVVIGPTREAVCNTESWQQPLHGRVLSSMTQSISYC